MNLLLTHSTETQLPELPLLLHRYSSFALVAGDARWRLFGIGITDEGIVGVQILQTFLPEEKHLGVAVLHKLDAIHRLARRLMCR